MTLLAVLLFCWLGSGRHALAETLAILDLRFEGVPPALIGPVRLRIQDSLAGLGYRVTDQVTARFQLRESPPGCTAGPCLARVGRTLQVELALVGALGSIGSSYELTLTMLETGGGTVVAQVSQRCDVCNFREVEIAAGRCAEKLHRQARAVLAMRSSLRIVSVPPGAEVVIDGLPQGPAPVRGLLPAGRHTVEALARGLPPLQRELELRAGEARSLTLDLIARRDELRLTSAAPAKTRYPEWVKWVFFSSGLAMVGPGAVLWAVDGRGGPAPGQGLDTAPAGIALTSAGGAALVAGTLLLVFEQR